MSLVLFTSIIGLSYHFRTILFIVVPLCTIEMHIICMRSAEYNLLTYVDRTHNMVRVSDKNTHAVYTHQQMNPPA